MAIEAPLTKHKKTNFIIYIVVCAAIAIYCTYDGYFNEKFKTKHTNEDGSPDSTLIFNQKAPPFFIGVAVLLGIYLFAIRNRKLIADEKELIFSNKEKISYDSVQKIDKTHFKLKGYFLITYKDKNGKESERKISDKKYDNLEAILGHLVAKIT
jgi:uncharacterized membrane protein